MELWGGECAVFEGGGGGIENSKGGDLKVRFEGEMKASERGVVLKVRTTSRRRHHTLAYQASPDSNDKTSRMKER